MDGWNTSYVSLSGLAPFSGVKLLASFQGLYFYLSSVQNPGWLGYIGDYTTQLYRDYNTPL